MMAQIIRITKEFHFEMAHVLLNYDGPCRNVHGHSYKLFVTISGSPDKDPESPKNGMVIDFSDLKRIVNTEVIDKFDHAVVINSRDNYKIEKLTSLFGNVVSVGYQPTCENLVSDFAVRISEKLPANKRLFSLKLYETATSYAEWYSDDNN